MSETVSRCGDAARAEKAEALRRELEGSPWFRAVGVGDRGGINTIFVYVSGQWPQGAIPEVWRGVPVWVRKVRP